MVLGLAGKSCAGKNQVSAILQSRGFLCLDMDLMAHEVLESLAGELPPLFGPSVVNREGTVNRKNLGGIVFKDSSKLKILENLLYPSLHKNLDKAIQREQEGTGRPVVINAAALAKGNFWLKCDKVWWVESPFILRFFRSLRRDGAIPVRILRRFAAQGELKPQYFFSRVDTSIIRNGFTPGALGKQVESGIKDLLAER